jgi:CheY-like chemotaxis protein
MNTAILVGKRVMVCEDELLVAMLIEDVLADYDCQLIGPFSTVTEALSAAETADIDIAVLDVNMRGERIYPVAERLGDRLIPFFLLSGYGEDALPANRQNWVACSKPFSTVDLVSMLVKQLEQSAGHP